MAEQESAKLGFSSVTASRSVPHEKSAIDNFPSSASGKHMELLSHTDA